VESIRLINLEVSGFGGNGILVETGNAKGFRDFAVEHGDIHDNGLSGIETRGNGNAYTHSDFRFSYTRCYNTPGQPWMTIRPSGNGFMIGSVDGAHIEYCEAYENGGRNVYLPVKSAGFMTLNSRNVVMEFCESRNNVAQQPGDGAGFRVDGGSAQCMVQYCYSHENAGPGYALHEFGSPNSFTGNVIRYNISQDDARRNREGALSLESLSPQNKLTGCEVFNNTFFLSLRNAGPLPSAIRLDGIYFDGLRITNNIFFVGDGIGQVTAAMAPVPAQVHFQRNNYFTSNSIPKFTWNGIQYSSFQDWKNAAPGQEMDGSMSLGTTADPLLFQPGGGTNVHPATGGDLSTVTAYKLQLNSPLINDGLNHPVLGNRDYYNNPTPYNNVVDVGAFEFSGAVLLPVRILSFNGAMQSGKALLQWAVSEVENVDRYELQRSVDARSFNTLQGYNAGVERDYQHVDAQPATTGYYRLKIFYTTGDIQYSGIIKLTGSSSGNKSLVYFHPGLGLQLTVTNPAEGWKKIEVLDAAGKLVLIRDVKLAKGFSLVSLPEALNWNRGVYFLRIGQETLRFIR
jgi:hypothetical protein